MPISTQSVTDALLNQEKQIQAIKDQIEKLVSKKTSRGFISQIASSYYHFSFWLKATLGLAVGAIGATAGFVFMPLMPSFWLVGSITGLISYLLPSLALIQQHRSEEKYQEALSSEILKLQHIYQESITAFNAFQTSAHGLVEALDKKNKEREQDNQTFRVAVTHFKENVQNTQTALQDLEHEHALMSHNNRLLADTVADTSTAHRAFNRAQQELNQINATLSETQCSLQKDADTFSKVTSRLEAGNADLQSLNQQFSILERHAQQNHKILQSHIDQLRQSMSNPYPEETAAQQCESSETLQKQALSSLSRYLSLRQKVFTPPQTESEPTLRV